MSDWLDEERALADELADAHDLRALRARVTGEQEEPGMVIELPAPPRRSRAPLAIAAAAAIAIVAGAWVALESGAGDSDVDDTDVAAMKREPAPEQPMVPLRVTNIEVIEGDVALLTFEGAEVVTWGGGDPVHVRPMDGVTGWYAMRAVPFGASMERPFNLDVVVDGRAERWRVNVKPRRTKYEGKLEVRPRPKPTDGDDSVRLTEVLRDDGGSVSDGLLAWPSLGHVTSAFGGERAFAYVAGLEGGGTGFGRHRGMDISGEVGDAVAAAAAGRVVLSERLREGGASVVLHHGDGFFTLYQRLEATSVSVSDVVNRGQIVGRLGNTGRSTGPHLHFAVHLGGHYVNPESLLPERAESRAPKATRASLTIYAKPWANVVLDGKKVGPTPILRHEVSPGRHDLLFSRPGSLPIRRAISVASGEAYRVSVSIPSEDENETAHLSKRALLDVIRAGKKDVRRCGDRFGLSGETLRVEFTVTPRGRAKNAVVLTAAYATEPVGECVVTAIEAWRFPLAKNATPPVRIPLKL